MHSLRGALSMFWTALFESHPRYERFSCKEGHVFGFEDPGNVCPTCGADVTVLLERRALLRLGWGELKRWAAPYRLTEFAPEKETVKETWRWHGRKLRERQVPNTIRWTVTEDDGSDPENEKSGT